MPSSPTRTRIDAALAQLRRKALLPRRLELTLAGRRMTAALDPPARSASVSVRSRRPDAEALVPLRPPSRLSVLVARRLVAATFDRVTGTLELTISRRLPAVAPQLATAPPRLPPRPALPRPADRPPVQAPARPREVVASPPPAPPPARPRAKWPAVAAAVVLLAVAGVAAAFALTRTGDDESAQAPPTHAVPTTRTKARKHTPAPGRTSTTAVAGARHTRRTPTTTAPPPVAQPAARELRWSPVRNAQVYWFELYRVGDLGSRKVLEAFPTEPAFTLPPSAFKPGLYNWSASPQTRRGARLRSTVLTRAGRFRITPDGQMVPVRS